MLANELTTVPETPPGGCAASDNIPEGMYRYGTCSGSPGNWCFGPSGFGAQFPNK